MTKELTEDQFDEQYKSLDGPDGSMIWEHDDVKDIPLNRVWTVVDGDEGQQCAMPGKHIVNKVGYLVTERPYTSDDITVTLSSTDDGYLDNDQFIEVTRDDYERWIEQGGEAFHVGDANFGDGDGADHIDDQRNQLTDMMCHMLHYARLEGLLDDTFTLQSVCDRLESHFGAENRAKLLPWQIELREGIVKVEPVKKATRAKKGGKK